MLGSRWAAASYDLVITYDGLFAVSFADGKELASFVTGRRGDDVVGRSRTLVFDLYDCSLCAAAKLTGLLKYGDDMVDDCGAALLLCQVTERGVFALSLVGDAFCSCTASWLELDLLARRGEARQDS